MCAGPATEKVPLPWSPVRRTASPQRSREAESHQERLGAPRRFFGRRLRAREERRSPEITHIDLRETRRYPCQVREEPRDVGVVHVTVLQSYVTTRAKVIANCHASMKLVVVRYPAVIPRRGSPALSRYLRRPGSSIGLRYAAGGSRQPLGRSISLYRSSAERRDRSMSVWSASRARTLSRTLRATARARRPCHRVPPRSARPTAGACRTGIDRSSRAAQKSGTRGGFVSHPRSQRPRGAEHVSVLRSLSLQRDRSSAASGHWSAS